MPSQLTFADSPMKPPDFADAKRGARPSGGSTQPFKEIQSNPNESLAPVEQMIWIAATSARASGYLRGGYMERRTAAQAEIKK